jgi:Methyltransferase domain
VGELTALRQRLVDGPDSLGQRNRQRRWAWLCEEFPGIESMSVIDLGGTVEAWLRAPVRPASVHVVNLEVQPKDNPDWLTAEQGDACALPASLDGAAFDLVFSNSVIEHVGGHAQRVKFAGEVHRLAPRHWVQTPYRYFPIEPHWLFPGFQFLPLAARAELSRRWPLVHTRSRSRDEGLRAVMGVELLGRAEMAFYFPHSTLMTERIGGMVKSLIATKTA